MTGQGADRLPSCLVPTIPGEATLTHRNSVSPYSLRESAAGASCGNRADAQCSARTRYRYCSRGDDPDCPRASLPPIRQPGSRAAVDLTFSCALFLSQRTRPPPTSKKATRHQDGLKLVSRVCFEGSEPSHIRLRVPPPPCYRGSLPRLADSASCGTVPNAGSRLIHARIKDNTFSVINAHSTYEALHYADILCNIPAITRQSPLACLLNLA